MMVTQSRRFEAHDASQTIAPSPRAIIGALVLALALVLLQLAGASDFVTDILSVSILTGTLAFARVLDRRMGVAGALIAGAAAAIVPGGTPTLSQHSAWEGLLRIGAFATMATVYYVVVVALRTREERLQRQFADLRILHEEVRALHVLAAGSPVNREAIYVHIAEAGARLADGAQSLLRLNDAHDAMTFPVAAWPSAAEPDTLMGGAITTEAMPDAVIADSARHQSIRVPIVGEAGTIGVIEVAQHAPHAVRRDQGDLLAIYARDAGLALEHIALRERLERLRLAEERARIARELHDGLVQTLGAIAYRMEYYADTLAPETAEAVRHGLGTASTDVRDALRQARLMIHGLRDVAHADSLRDRLRVMLEAVARETEIVVSADLPEQLPTLPVAYVETICAVAQEALHNVTKHADAEAVALVLLAAQGRIELTITDDGRGFQDESESADALPLRYGLLGMRERAAQQGGNVTIQSAPGMGTCVTLSLPVEEAA